MNGFRIVRSFLDRARNLERRIERLQEAVGRIETRLTNPRDDAEDLRAAEFRVFSQWGEDGILQRLIRQVPVTRHTFVEFGVQDYSESNTRFLLVNNNWSGLVIDSSPTDIESIKSDEIFWRYNLKAECALVTRDNINTLLRANGLTGDIGVLSIDIDGNDYWIWEAIDAVRPNIVVVEYNARFGPQRAVTVPYDANFARTRAHFSSIYYGASLAALVALGSRKGYDFVGGNAAGNNAVFVLKELRPSSLPAKSAAEGFVQGHFREARNPDGSLAFLSLAEEQKILESLPLVEVAP